MEGLPFENFLRVSEPWRNNGRFFLNYNCRLSLASCCYKFFIKRRIQFLFLKKNETSICELRLFYRNWFETTVLRLSEVSDVLSVDKWKIKEYEKACV
jgi:hypothetical protein